MTNNENMLSVYAHSGGVSTSIGGQAWPNDMDDIWKSFSADIHIEKFNPNDDDDCDFPSEENFIGDMSFESYSIDTLTDILNGKPLDKDYMLGDFGMKSHTYATVELLMNPENRQKLCDHLGMRDINQIVTLNTFMLKEGHKDRELGMQAIELFMRLTGTTRTLFLICPSNPLSVASYDQSSELESHFKANGFISMQEVTGQKIMHSENTDWEILFKPAFKVESEKQTKAT